MYYDLVASLPRLPQFTRADHLPITPLRLGQRLRRLRPEHADQLARARALVPWRPERLRAGQDRDLVAGCAAFCDAAGSPPLRAYVAFRIDQKTLLAALRRKQAGLAEPERDSSWGAGPRVHLIHRNWERPDFGLAHVYPWLPPARELLAAGDARGLERLLIDVAWRWLGRRAEANMFDFAAVFSYVFRWDMLRAWLASDAEQATARFRDLIDKVTHGDND